MNKSILLKLALILLLINKCSAQNKNILEYQNDNLIQNLGIGLIQLVNTNKGINLYSDSTLSKIKIKNAKINSNFVPILNKPDYGILFFVCLEKNPVFYKIAISKSNYAYIKISQDLIYYDWQSFLKEEITSIQSKSLKNNPPRDSIDGKPINTKKWKSDDEIEIIKVQNNWLKIKNTTRNNQIYCIEWKDDKVLKVYLNLLV